MSEYSDDDGIEKGSASDDRTPALLQDSSKETIVKLIDKYLSTPRFSDDVCLILNMPENFIKKNKEKLNAAIWNVYNSNANKRSDENHPFIRMIDILVAIETMVDATKLAIMLDNDIKLLVAREMSITVSETELDIISAEAIKRKKKSSDAENDDADDTDDIEPEKSYEEKLLEDDPDEEAEIMKDLI